MAKPYTSIEISAQGFALKCPYCSDVVREITVGKLHQLEFECESCLETLQLSVTLSSQGD